MNKSDIIVTIQSLFKTKLASYGEFVYNTVIKPAEVFPMSEDFGPNIVTVIDEETGEEIELEFIDALEYNGAVYRAFFPVVDEEESSKDEEEYGLIILKAEMENGEEMLVQIEDENEINTVYDLFMEQFFEDEES